MAETRKSMLDKLQQMLKGIVENGWNPDQFATPVEWAEWIGKQTTALAEKFAAASGTSQKEQPTAAPAVRRRGKRTREETIAAAKRDADKNEAAMNKGNRRRAPPKN